MNRGLRNFHDTRRSRVRTRGLTRMTGNTQRPTVSANVPPRRDACPHSSPATAAHSPFDQRRLRSHCPAVRNGRRERCLPLEPALPTAAQGARLEGNRTSDLRKRQCSRALEVLFLRTEQTCRDSAHRQHGIHPVFWGDTHIIHTFEAWDTHVPCEIQEQREGISGIPLKTHATSTEMLQRQLLHRLGKSRKRVRNELRFRARKVGDSATSSAHGNQCGRNVAFSRQRIPGKFRLRHADKEHPEIPNHCIELYQKLQRCVPRVSHRFQECVTQHFLLS